MVYRGIYLIGGSYWFLQRSCSSDNSQLGVKEASRFIIKGVLLRRFCCIFGHCDGKSMAKYIHAHIRNAPTVWQLISNADKTSPSFFFIYIFFSEAEFEKDLPDVFNSNSKPRA